MRPLFCLLSLFIFLTACDSPDSKTRGEHQVTATVQINPTSSLPHSERFIPNQIALLTTGTILNPAAENCDLDANTIFSSLEIQPIKDSDCFNITVHHNDKEQAQVVVKAVLDSYQLYRQNLAAKTLVILDEKFRVHSHLLECSREALATFVGAYGILNLNNPESLPTTEQEMFRNARRKLADLETKRDQLEIQISAKVANSGPPRKTTLRHDLNEVDRQIERIITMVNNRLSDRFEILATLRKNTFNELKEAHLQALAFLREIEAQRQEVRDLSENGFPIFSIHGWE